jgi:hypothetical protein
MEKGYGKISVLTSFREPLLTDLTGVPEKLSYQCLTEGKTAIHKINLASGTSFG